MVDGERKEPVTLTPDKLRVRAPEQRAHFCAWQVEAVPPYLAPFRNPVPFPPQGSWPSAGGDIFDSFPRSTSSPQLPFPPPTGR